LLPKRKQVGGSAVRARRLDLLKHPIAQAGISLLFGGSRQEL
jgi:hypothetical protein